MTYNLYLLVLSFKQFQISKYFAFKFTPIKHDKNYL